MDFRCHCNSLANEYIMICSNRLDCRRNARAGTSWECPPDGWVKINTDGAVTGRLNLATIGGVMRNNVGAWIFGFSRGVGCCSVLMAELWAVHDALLYAWNFGYNCIILESDSKEVIEILNGSSVALDGSSLVSTIVELLLRNWIVRCCHVFRESNMVADKLASVVVLTRWLLLNEIRNAARVSSDSTAEIRSASAAAMVLKTELCRFSGAKIYPGKGIRFVRSDSQVFLFSNSKCKRYFHNRLKPSKLTWTAMYRKQHKKDIAQEAVKKRRRATKKPYSRSIVGATLEVIQKKRSEKPEVRDAAREAALREIKERIKKTKDEKKAKKAEVAAKQQKTQGKGSNPKGGAPKGPKLGGGGGKR
ncbi:hypothetical protein GQ457_08G018660 [Hibiscus cannabinus]